MKDLANAKWMYVKAVLFLIIGLSAGALLIVEHPHFKTALLLCLLVWAMCRTYYFAFYVVQHYIDPTYKFSGLLSFLRYLLRRS
jgi:hypothetical protein